LLLLLQKLLLLLKRDPAETAGATALDSRI
jgi:hypothetical protein